MGQYTTRLWGYVPEHNRIAPDDFAPHRDPWLGATFKVVKWEGKTFFLAVRNGRCGAGITKTEALGRLQWKETHDPRRTERP